MGKLSNMMYMIDLLNTGNIYTLKELSEKLGVTERMIRYYKNEICANGIAISMLIIFALLDILVLTELIKCF